ncbi:34466_t:CDS:1 [Gigaspora margarita]|uniref:34466_t:CDS:1 n=1 Tax=Gigaspora margarita TaxID=4874 RepID=A0ABN7W0A1_GIGMA|nr:34466_t:CDS:1 [Gigaspora margarita]
MNSFYLDVPKPFTTTDNDSIPWIDLIYSCGPWKEHTYIACIGRKSSSQVFIFGYNQSFVNQFYISEQQLINFTSTWSIPTVRIGISCANINNELDAILEIEALLQLLLMNFGYSIH